MQLPKLSETQVQRFQSHSILHVPSALSPNDSRKLRQWVEETEV